MRHGRWVAAGLVALAACQGEDLSSLVPMLEVVGATPDATGAADWVLDFGDTPVGASTPKGVRVMAAGRVPLNVEPTETAAPFACDPAQATRVAAGDTLELVCRFRPEVEGAASGLARIVSDGGEATVRLVGKGIPASEGCKLVFDPPAIDFGTLALGGSFHKTLALRNDGRRDCTVARLEIGAGSDPSFTVPGSPWSAVVPPESVREVGVRFAPTRYGRMEGSLAVHTESPDALVMVALAGAAPEPCPGALPDGTCPRATESAYVNTSEILYSHDPVAGRTTRVGTFRAANGSPIPGFTDIAIDSNGLLFGFADRKFYVINPNTAEASQVSMTDVTDGTGLTFLPDGKLVVAGPRLDIVDRTTGRRVRTLVPAGRFDTSGDIVALPDGFLYWAVRGPGGDALVRVDPQSGATTTLGAIGVTGVYGLGYANDKLLGYTKAGRVVEIDPRTGRASRNTALGGDWWGATTNPARW